MVVVSSLRFVQLSLESKFVDGAGFEGVVGSEVLAGGIEGSSHGRCRISQPVPFDSLRSLRTKFPEGILVPKEGLEPTRACAHCDLNAARLPIPPLRPDTLPLGKRVKKA